MKKRNLGIALSYFTTFLSMATGLFLSSFVLQQLGDSEYGVYQTISSLANYLVLLEFGTGTVMVRNLSACRARNESTVEKEKNIATILGISNGLAIVIAIVSVVFYFLIDNLYANSMTSLQIASSKRMFIFITIHLLAAYFSQAISGVILAHKNYTYGSIVAIIKLILRTLLIVVALLSIKQALVITIIDGVLSCLLIIVGYVYCRKKLHVRISMKGFDKAIFKASLPLCLALFLQTIVNQANNTVGKFMLGIWSNPETVALYSVALYIFSLFSSLATIPLSMYSPQITENVVLGLNGKALTETLIQPSRLVVVISGSVLFGFIAAGKPFLHIVYGEKYNSAWILAIILMAPMFVNMSNSVIISILDAQNKRLVRSLILMITTILNIFLTLILIQQIGILGAALATGIATALQVITTNYYYHNYIHIKIGYLFRNVFRGVLPYQILGSAVGYFVGSLPNNPYLCFLIGGCAYIVVAFGGFLLFGKNDFENAAIHMFISKLKKKKQI